MEKYILKRLFVRKRTFILGGLTLTELFRLLPCYREMERDLVVSWTSFLFGWLFSRKKSDHRAGNHPGMPSFLMSERLLNMRQKRSLFAPTSWRSWTIFKRDEQVSFNKWVVAIYSDPISGMVKTYWIAQNTLKNYKFSVTLPYFQKMHLLLIKASTLDVRKISVLAVVSSLLCIVVVEID